MLRRLDTLCHHFLAERVRHRDDRLGERRRRGVVGHVLEERAVDLDDADRPLPEVVEGRIPGSEVVEREPHAELGELADGAARGIVEQHRLGDLDLEGRCGYAVLVEGAPHEPRELRVLELLHRDVDREPARGNALFAPDRHLRAGRFQHPAPDVDDQPADLGGRDEFLGAARAVARGLPAQQRLEADQAAVAQAVLRLVEQRELALAQRTIEPALGGVEALQHQVLVEEHRAPATQVLGAVHRAVGAPHQVVDGQAVVREQRHADARLDVVVAAGEVHGHADRLDDALGDHRHGVRVGHVAQDHRELVACQPRHGVAFLHAGAQPLRHDHQQLVAGGVADAVVDLLEVVEVDVEQRASRLRLGAVGDLLRQPVAEQQPVGQRREWIVVRLAIEVLVPRRLRQRDGETRCEFRAVAREARILRGSLGEADRQHGGQPRPRDDRPHPEELGAEFAQRLEEIVPALLAAGDRDALLGGQQRGDQLGIEFHAGHGQRIEPVGRDEHAPQRGRVGIEQRDAHGAAARHRRDPREDRVEHRLELSGAEQQAVDLAERLQGGDVVGQARAGRIDGVRQRPQLLGHRRRGQRTEAVATEPQQPRAQLDQRQALLAREPRGTHHAEREGAEQERRRPVLPGLGGRAAGHPGAGGPDVPARIGPHGPGKRGARERAGPLPAIGIPAHARDRIRRSAEGARCDAGRHDPRRMGREAIAAEQCRAAIVGHEHVGGGRIQAVPEPLWRDLEVNELLAACDGHAPHEIDVGQVAAGRQADERGPVDVVAAGTESRHRQHTPGPRHDGSQEDARAGPGVGERGRRGGRREQHARHVVGGTDPRRDRQGDGPGAFDERRIELAPGAVPDRLVTEHQRERQRQQDARAEDQRESLPQGIAD